MYLDSLDPFFCSVGWGALGRGGSLGYGEQSVSVAGQPYPHALSAHAPSRLMFDLGGRYSLFRTGVAVNEGVPAAWSRADFCVIADGAPIAEAREVEAGAPARFLEADVTGVRTLELIVRAPDPNHAHTVWLDPALEPAPALPTTPPVRGPEPGDGYADFLDALRVWLGTTGIGGLHESFYGTTDGGVAVADASVFPLFATLHYLVRSNGCARVVECGTGRGVSTACIASAIAHRDDARVVTLDVAVGEDREELWRGLPRRMQDCIEARTIDSLAGLRAARDSGERFHAALLDSVHEAAHVVEEFQLASELVCENGLILIHDATYARGSVGTALEQIERSGYNVVRLWVAAAGALEDDGLGLAIIENRIRRDERATPAEKRAEEPAEKPAAKPAEKRAEKPAEKRRKRKR
jgi:hypothetical protein